MSIKIRLKIIASEASERKNEKNWRFGHKIIIGPRPLGGGARRVRPPPLDPLVSYIYFIKYPFYLLACLFKIVIRWTWKTPCWTWTLPPQQNGALSGITGYLRVRYAERVYRKTQCALWWLESRAWSLTELKILIRYHYTLIIGYKSCTMLFYYRSVIHFLYSVQLLLGGK